jgi:hypothetical protein
MGQSAEPESSLEGSFPFNEILSDLKILFSTASRTNILHLNSRRPAGHPYDAFLTSVAANVHRIYRTGHDNVFSFQGTP